MNNKHSPRTQFDLLAQKMLFRWVPKWHGAFCNPATGLFHERLGHAFRPVPMPHMRLLSQCRQLAVYASALYLRPDLTLTPELPISFDAFVAHYHVPETGGWRFSITPDLKPMDNHYDLYGQAFILFALAHYGRVYPQSSAPSLAIRTAEFIHVRFRIDGQKGFTEALDENLKPRAQARRHESHMHLFEACLFCAEIFDAPIFKNMTDEMVDLFFTHLYAADKNILSEYFGDDLTPKPNDHGHIVIEAGHYGEWVWLLKKHARLSGDPQKYDAVCQNMMVWANRYGWDEKFGGVYDELNDAYQVIADTKRLWPFAEMIKANAFMLDSGMDRDEIKDVLQKMVNVFTQKYMDERGFWTESLSRDLTPITDYMPATTPYHVYFGVMETRSALTARGTGKSWRAPIMSSVYAFKRRVSEYLQRLKKKF